MPETTSAWVDMLGGEISYFDDGTYRTRCLHAGSGSEPPLVLLHGIGGHAEAYLKNVLTLATTLEDRAVYAIDLLGHGFTSKPGSYRLEDYANHVEAFIEHLDYDSVHLSGESLGGWITSWMAVNRSDHLETICLNTTAGLTKDLHRRALSDEQITQMEGENQDLMDRTKEMIEHNYPRELVERRVDWLFHDEPPQELVDIRYQLYQRDDVQAEMPRIYEATSEFGRIGDEDFKSIDLPTLIIHTDHNPGTPADTMRYVDDNLLEESEIYVYEQAAHWPQWEQADKFNDHLTEFITAHT